MEPSFEGVYRQFSLLRDGPHRTDANCVLYYENRTDLPTTEQSRCKIHLTYTQSWVLPRKWVGRNSGECPTFLAFCASPQVSINTLIKCKNALQAGPTSPGSLAVIPVLLCTSPHHGVPPWKAAFNSNDWRGSPVYPDVFLKRRLGNREKSSFIPLFTSRLSLNPLLCSLANFSNVDATKRSTGIV